jgi:putative transposase
VLLKREGWQLGKNQTYRLYSEEQLQLRSKLPRRRNSGQLLDLWAYHHKAKIDFSRPGKPTDNCHIETFNRSFRDECLNLHWFETLEEAKAIIEAWRRDYNESQPHSTLNDLSPAEFLRRTSLPGPVRV